MSNRRNFIAVNTGLERTMTKAEWRARFRACRVINRMIMPAVDKMADEAFTSLILYGHWEFRIPTFGGKS